MIDWHAGTKNRSLHSCVCRMRGMGIPVQKSKIDFCILEKQHDRRIFKW